MFPVPKAAQIELRSGRVEAPAARPTLSHSAAATSSSPPLDRGLHPSIFRLNVSVFYGTRGAYGVFTVYFWRGKRGCLGG